MEQAYCTAVFWRGGEKIDLKGLKPNEVRCLTVSGEKNNRPCISFGISKFRDVDIGWKIFRGGSAFKFGTA